MASKIEFFVEMTCESCVESIKKCLNSEVGIKNVDVQLNNGTVIIETTLAINKVQDLLQSTGRKAVLKGSASSLAAVAVIEAGDRHVQGVIRFMKNENTDTCIIDGTVDGLQSFAHTLRIYECGDISNGCESVGSLYEPESVDGGKKFSSTVGTFHPEQNGRASFRIIKDLNLLDVIGRSVVIIRENERKVACGIIARSAGIFQNPKTICACDGVSIWDENDKPKPSL